MEKISVKTFATWEAGFNIFGAFTTPLILRVVLYNNTNTPVTINGICISIKNFIFSSEDVLGSSNIYTVPAAKKFEFEFDIRHIQQSYRANKKFTVKVFDNNGNTYESDRLTINLLQNIKTAYTR